MAISVSVSMVLAALAYFALGCALCWLIAAPQARARRVRLRWPVMALRLPAWLAACAGLVPRRPRRRTVWLLALVLAALAAPAAIVWLGSGRDLLDAQDYAEAPGNAQVLALLNGEQLAPPQALPPRLFLSEEVRALRPALAGASRNWDLLDREFAQRLLLLFKIMREKYGYEMAILEGYRSPERQQWLAAMGPQVTNAGAFQSFHQFGLAADCAFLRGGKLLISEKDPWAMQGYRYFGEVAESLGLHWGGRWAMRDFGHAELRRAGSVRKIAPP